MTGVGFACLTICARSLWGGRGVGPASQNRLNLLSRRCGPGGGVAFVFTLALALHVCLLLCEGVGDPAHCMHETVLHLILQCMTLQNPWDSSFVLGVHCTCVMLFHIFVDVLNPRP